MELSKKISEIYEVFKEFFGENLVDIQRHTNSPKQSWNADYNIVVYWPKVTITNEYDNSIDIWGLYACVPIYNSGRMATHPYFLRTEYNTLQWNSRYRHSHIPSLDYNNFDTWSNSCLGSGPIRSTISTLQIQGNTVDINIWRLYCVELDKYVHVESVSGGPYYRMDSIGNRSSHSDAAFNLNNTFIPIHYKYRTHSTSSNDINYTLYFKSFMKYLIEKNVFKYAYINGSYVLATSFIETVMLMSNAFIDYYNSNKAFRTLITKEQLKAAKFIREAYIVYDRIYYKTDLYDNVNVCINDYIGRVMFYFKGEPVTLKCNDFNALPEKTTTVISIEAMERIIYRLLRFINTYYGKENRFNKRVRIF